MDAIVIKRVAGPQTYDVTVGETTYIVRKFCGIWEALKLGQLIAYGSSRREVIAKLERINKS